jgi:hypothetical protein
VPQRTRMNLALAFMGLAIILNLIVLFSGDTSAGWPIAAVIFLGAASVAILVQRRDL